MAKKLRNIMAKREKKQTIHIWKGPSGTVCGLDHYPEDGFVRLSKMETPASIQVNCEMCLGGYIKLKG